MFIRNMVGETGGTVETSVQYLQNILSGLGDWPKVECQLQAII